MDGTEYENMSMQLAIVNLDWIEMIRQDLVSRSISFFHFSVSFSSNLVFFFFFSSLAMVVVPEPPKEVGASIPAHTPHAVSVMLPTWQDNIGYEEGDPRVTSRMQCGYPRFFIHPFIKQVLYLCCITPTY